VPFNGNLGSLKIEFIEAHAEQFQNGFARLQGFEKPLDQEIRKSFQINRGVKAGMSGANGNRGKPSAVVVSTINPKLEHALAR
jgi:hypothetical protein